jgi:hypothetical protein
MVGYDPRPVEQKKQKSADWLDWLDDGTGCGRFGASGTSTAELKWANDAKRDGKRTTPSGLDGGFAG